MNWKKSRHENKSSRVEYIHRIAKRFANRF